MISKRFCDDPDLRELGIPFTPVATTMQLLAAQSYYQKQARRPILAHRFGEVTKVIQGVPRDFGPESLLELVKQDQEIRRTPSQPAREHVVEAI